jgi:uncharacterized spore protein YtfJ
MINELREATASTNNEPAFGGELVRRIYDAATPAAVYGQPIVHGEYMIVTASEVAAGGGFGFGRGFGIDPSGNVSTSGDSSSGGGGGAGGGGGGAGGRPVAVIEIGPNGVRIKPVVDVTKFMLGAISAWVAIAVALGKWRRFRLPWAR